MSETRTEAQAKQKHIYRIGGKKEMKETIIDNTNLDIELEDYLHVMPRLKEAILKLGGKLNEQVFPSIDEMREVIKAPKHRLFEKYYGTSDIVEVYNIMMTAGAEKQIDEQYHEFIRNWRASKQRQMSVNKMQEVRKWGTELDPLSKLVAIVDMATTVDNACFDYTKEDKIWLEHNKDYYSKMGFSSQYYPSLLVRSAAEYGKTGRLNITDNEINKIAVAVIEMQKTLEGISIVPMRLEDVHEEALDRNNKAAESAPGFRNQKHTEVREEVLEDAYFIKENCDYTDLQLINEQKRIQSGGNVLFKDYYPMEFNTDGTLIFEFDAVVQAINQIKIDRGTFQYFSDEIVQPLPQLASVINTEPLPFSPTERERLLDAGYPEFIMRKDKLTKEWMYNYVTDIPNAFTLVKDIYPDEEEFANEIYTKHRSIKAAMSSHSRVGQSYLYPFMKALKDKHLVYGSPYFSLVAQWSHPDDIKTFVTDMLVASVPSLFEGLNIDTTYSKEALDKYTKAIDEMGATQYVSSDDKKGFDTRNKFYKSWLFYTAYFSLAFEMNEENVRLIKMFAMNELFSLVSQVDGLYMLSAIIASGQFTTSIGGTYHSNIQSLTNRALFMDESITRYIEQVDDQDDYDPHGPDDSGPIGEYTVGGGGL